MTAVPVDEAADEVRAVLERWVGAVQHRDLDGVLRAHGDDVVMFDVPPPDGGVRGLEAYAATWPPFFGWLEAGARFELDELHVETSADLAFAWALLRCGVDDELRTDPERRLRLTIGLRRRTDGWEMIHEHHSFTHR